MVWVFDIISERVAVGRRLRDLVGADHRAGARAVLDHDRLLEGRLEVLPDIARIDVGRAAGPERHDDPHGPRRVVLGGAGAREPGRRREGEADGGETHSRFLPMGLLGRGLDDGSGRRAAGPAAYWTCPILRTAVIRRALSASTKRAKSGASW